MHFCIVNMVNWILLMGVARKDRYVSLYTQMFFVTYWIYLPSPLQ